MPRKQTKIMFTLMLLLLLVTCGCTGDRPVAEGQVSPGDTYEEEGGQQEIEHTTLEQAIDSVDGNYISVLPEAQAALYPYQSQDMYHGLVIEAKDSRRYFDWHTLAAENWPPQMYYEDINGDGLKEIIVVLITGTGTGVHSEDVHVLEEHTLEELPVEGLEEILENHVQSSITNDGERVTIQITVDGVTTTIVKDAAAAIIWRETIGFGISFSYEISDGALILNTAGFASVGGLSVGNLRVVYGFEEDGFVATEVVFQEYSS